MMRATVVVDLSDGSNDRMRLACLPNVPRGARVVVAVGDTWPDFTLVDLLAAEEARLTLDFQGGFKAVERWLDAVGGARR